MIASQLAVWSTAVCSFFAADPPRLEMSLNGPWQFQMVTELNSPPTSGDWKAIEIPGTLRGYNYERAWFRRTFSVPPGARQHRIKIQFDGVKYNSRVLVNGTQVGGCFNGYDAFEVDVTDAVRFDRPNELAVGVHDWTGVFTPGKVDFSVMPAWQRARRFVTDKVIAPIGGLYDHYGIWGDVRLRCLPDVHVQDLFIQPSVRRGELVVDATIVNESDHTTTVDLRAAVEDQGKDCLTFPPARIDIPAGGQIKVTLKQPWSDARYWSHYDPYLYHLRTELSTGDVERTRFGFREFWIEGHRYFLNGVKVNLLGSSWWPPEEPMERSEIEQRWQALKDSGCVCFRTHTQPWRRLHYDVADEIGLLMIIEGAMWHDPYCTCYDDATFWDNYAKMIQAMIQREKNRPSVIMWSMENEAYGGGEAKTALAHQNLARVGRMAKQWDPTRPIYFESDGDPEGVADAIGMHYVHEYPQHTCWPNEAYWLDQPFHPHTWFGIKEATTWKKEKPLYIGEFLWVPSGTPAAHTVFLGDDAYQDLGRATRLAKGEAWKMQILAFRHQEIGGMCPWTVGTDLSESNPLYRAHQYAYQHIAAYCHDYDARFFSGEQVARRLEVFNEQLKSTDLTLKWTLFNGANTVDHYEERFPIEAGGRKEIQTTLQMPTVTRRTELRWQLTIEQDGKMVFDDSHDYSVFPQIRLPNMSANFGLFDPSGETGRWLSAAGASFTRVDSLANLASTLDVLIIGRGALRAQQRPDVPMIGQVNPQRAALMAFVARGGRILVLQQDAYPEGLFATTLTSKSSTMTFPLQPSHPALKGLKPDDLKFWRGDFLVSDRELPRPASGSTRPIISSGSATGLSSVPLLERPLGRGSIIHSQLNLVNKAHTEPAAGTILGNLLSYLASCAPKSRKTGVLGGTASYHEFLREAGLRYDRPDPRQLTQNLSDYALLVCRGEVEAIEQLAPRLHSFVADGGNLLVHRPAAKTMAALAATLHVDLTVQPYTGPIRRAEGTHTLLESVTREDLYWTVKEPGLSWAVQPPATDVTDGMFGTRLDVRRATAYEVEDWKSEGQYVQASPQGVVFATVGTATTTIDFPHSGSYAIGVRARGTSCRGVFPLVKISVDGTTFGFIQLDSEDWRSYGVAGKVEKGKREVTLAFVNDASDPPLEDRNLEIDKCLIQVDDRADEMVFLNSPPATACLQRGTGGKIIFDLMRWDTDEAQNRMATRFACSLLTELDADLMPRSMVSVECDKMTPQPEMQYFQNNGGVAAMNCSGYIKTNIEIAESREYAMDVIAAGTPCEGVFPIVEIQIDGRKIGQVQLSTSGWRAYGVSATLDRGKHELALVFANDGSSPSGEDRNLELDKIVFYND